MNTTNVQDRKMPVNWLSSEFQRTCHVLQLTGAVSSLAVHLACIRTPLLPIRSIFSPTLS